MSICSQTQPLKCVCVHEGGGLGGHKSKKRNRVNFRTHLYFHILAIQYWDDWEVPLICCSCCYEFGSFLLSIMYEAEV